MYYIKTLDQVPRELRASSTEGLTDNPAKHYITRVSAIGHKAFITVFHVSQNLNKKNFLFQI
jgi:hypothetical protein